jgi:hypothetical protein
VLRVRISISGSDERKECTELSGAERSAPISDTTLQSGVHRAERSTGQTEQNGAQHGAERRAMRSDAESAEQSGLPVDLTEP